MRVVDLDGWPFAAALVLGAGSPGEVRLDPTPGGSPIAVRLVVDGAGARLEAGASAVAWTVAPDDTVIRAAAVPGKGGGYQDLVLLRAGGAPALGLLASQPWSREQCEWLETTGRRVAEALGAGYREYPVHADA